MYSACHHACSSEKKYMQKRMSSDNSIEIKETLVIKSDSPKVAEWVKRMKAYKAAQLQDMAKRGCEVCDIAM